MRAEVFDLLILGGGINGAGIARDSALRGVKTALIEKAHFASGASGRNSQLVHGGLRYLKYFEFGLVREALQERATLMRIAPHLVIPLPLLLPFSRWLDRRFYGMGLWLYDTLAGSENVGRRSYLSHAELQKLEPEMASQEMHSAALFYDCRMHAARLLLENLFDAARHGTAIANYTRAESWKTEGGGFALTAREQFSGAEFVIRGRKLVDARGPWDDSGSVRLVRGSHIVIPRVNRSANAIAHFHADGRIIFLIPWGPNESLSLVGTTDVDHLSSADDVRISADEVRYLQGIVRGLFPSANVEPVAAYSSLRPLVVAGGSATAASRSHRIWMNGDGILKIAGGKYTTYRSMAEEACDLLFADLVGRCCTAEEKLGNAVEGVSDAGMIRHAVVHEMAMRLPDVLYSTTYWGHENRVSRDFLTPLAKKMGELLGWNESRIEEEIHGTLNLARMPVDSTSRTV